MRLFVPQVINGFCALGGFVEQRKGGELRGVQRNVPEEPAAVVGTGLQVEENIYLGHRLPQYTELVLLQ